MMLTEDEAKSKWCPLAHGERLNRDVPCIGSACMAWRAMLEDCLIKKGGGQPDGSGWVKDEGYESSVASNVYERWTRTVGYCGAFRGPK